MLGNFNILSHFPPPSPPPPKWLGEELGNKYKTTQMSRENLKGKPLQRTWLNRSSHDVAKTWNQKFFFSSVCQSGTQLAILINKKPQTKPHDEKTSAPMMPQSNLFYCCSRVALGIMMAALCLWKIHSADGHVSVCLM